MKKNKPAFMGALNSLGVLAYILLVVTLISNASTLFGPNENKTIIPIAMLLLFVSSALLTGFLILGRPLMLYLDGQKKEALKLLFYTGAWLFIFTLLFFTVLFITR